MKSVFANGIWKSGNNLLKKALYLMGSIDAGWGIGAHLLFGRDQIIRTLLRGSKNGRGVLAGLEVPITISPAWLQYRLRQSAAKCVGGHAPYSLHLEKMLTDQDFRMIQIIRDPRDVLVSFAYWIEKRPDFFPYRLFAPLTVEERINTLMAGSSLDAGFVWEPFSVIMDRSLGWLKKDNVLVVRFEDLVGTHGGGDNIRQASALKRIAEWIGTQVDADMVAENLFGGTPTFRKGEIGNWNNVLTAKNRELFASAIGSERISYWGYKD